jgi:hypothetical protein
VILICHGTIIYQLYNVYSLSVLSVDLTNISAKRVGWGGDSLFSDSFFSILVIALLRHGCHKYSVVTTATGLTRSRSFLLPTL